MKFIKRLFYRYQKDRKIKKEFSELCDYGRILSHHRNEIDEMYKKFARQADINSKFVEENTNIILRIKALEERNRQINEIEERYKKVKIERPSDTI